MVARLASVHGVTTDRLDREDRLPRVERIFEQVDPELCDSAADVPVLSRT